MDRHDNLEAKLRDLGREARTSLPALAPPEGARRRIKTRRALTAGLSGALVIALAAGAMAGMKLLPGEGSKGSVDLSDAVAATEQTSAKVRAEGQYTFEGGPFTEKASEGTMTMQGVIDFATGDGILTMTTDTFLADGNMTTLTVDGKTYIKSDPPLDPDRPWLVSGIKTDESSVFGMQPQTDANSYLKEILNLVDIEDLGREQIDGVQTTHYRGKVDEDLLPSQSGQTGEMGPWDIWIGDDLLVRRMAMSVAFSSEEAGSIEMSFDMTYYDFGVMVDLEAPPADQVRDADDELPQPAEHEDMSEQTLFYELGGRPYGGSMFVRREGLATVCVAFPDWASIMHIHGAAQTRRLVTLDKADALYTPEPDEAASLDVDFACFGDPPTALDLVIDHPEDYQIEFHHLLSERAESSDLVPLSAVEGTDTSEVDPELGPIAQVLMDAVTAEEAFYKLNDHYTAIVSKLQAEGLIIPEGIKVRVASPFYNTYCLEAWNKDGHLYFDKAYGFPKEGTCADAG